MTLSQAAEYYPGSTRKIGYPKGPRQESVDDEKRWDRNPRVFRIPGKGEVEFFTVGDLALAMGDRKPVTIRKWEAEGVIPRPTFWKPSEDPRGKRRLYSREQVEGMIQIAEEEGILWTAKANIKKTNFTARVFDLFRELAKA